jgi:hypothetical protein
MLVFALGYETVCPYTGLVLSSPASLRGVLGPDLDLRLGDRFTRDAQARVG